MNDDRTLYEERTPWAGWVRMLLWGAVAVACYPVLAGGDTGLPPSWRVLIAAGCAAFAAAIEALLGGLTVQVRESRLFIHLGRGPLIRRSVPLKEIVSLESVQYRPIRDYGGWGVRGWGSRKAWSARGDQAVALELEGERLLLVGSDHPRRLEERIRSAMTAM
jgi:hypothetical protein